MSKAKLMLGNAVEISLFFHRILGPLVLGWAPNHFVLGAQLAPGEKRLVCIPGPPFHSLHQQKACHLGSRRKLPPQAYQVRPELHSVVCRQ